MSHNFSPLISVEGGESAPVKKLNGLVEGGTFDQILDLGAVPDSNKGLVPELPAPMMAFEESIQQQSNSAATDGKYLVLLKLWSSVLAVKLLSIILYIEYSINAQSQYRVPFL